VPYKRVDLIVRAFAAMPEQRLVVIGDGPDAAKVRAAATVHGRAAPNVEFTGHLTREALRERLRGARAFIFAAQEDFGIAPVEAQACGVPVIAYGTGGIAETVAPLGGASPTGVHFAEQTEAAIMDAVRRFEASAGAITARACRERAERFSAPRFRAALTAWVARECAARAG
jgi:glycosyltransferase involved in cell wall biosynthesis